jgi:hypothetical protein
MRPGDIAARLLTTTRLRGGGRADLWGSGERTSLERERQLAAGGARLGNGRAAALRRP